MSGKAQQQSRIKELITLGREQKYLTYAEVNDPCNFFIFAINIKLTP